MKPILFNTEMTKAILEGRKSVTRRVIKLDLGLADTDKLDSSYLMIPDEYGDSHDAKDLCKYQAGDILYVRETWTELCTVDERGYTDFDDITTYYYADGIPDIELRDADGFLLEDQAIKWKSSIHMPKDLARIFLKVIDVRVERICNMLTIDFLNEGIELYKSDGRTEKSEIEIEYEFEDLWDSTVKKDDIDKYGWDANPWVWIIEFERVEV